MRRLAQDIGDVGHVSDVRHVRYISGENNFSQIAYVWKQMLIIDLFKENGKRPIRLVRFILPVKRQLRRLKEESVVVMFSR